MITYFYIYAPFSGTNWGQNTYCATGNPHPTEVYCCPIDIGRGGVTAMRIYVSSNIKSVQLINYNTICGPAPWCNGFKVKFYRDLNAQTYLGAALYGHVDNRIPTGIYNNPNGLQIGDACPNTCNCNQNGLCYDGVHIHMEREAGGESKSFACGASIYGGSTWIYRFLVETP